MMVEGIEVALGMNEELCHMISVVIEQWEHH